METNTAGIKTKKLTGSIITYSRKAREIVVGQANAYLSQYGVPSISANLFLIVDELVKNAVKANYKFVLIRDKMTQRLKKTHPNTSDDQLEIEIEEIVKDQKTYDLIANQILSSEDMGNNVRMILNEESKLLNLKNKAYGQKRGLSPEERATIAELNLLNETQRKIKRTEMKIILKIEVTEKDLRLEITNTAPILGYDLRRIARIRQEFNRYRLEGRAAEFFVTHLDTSESGFGLGYATIDSIIANWGIDPLKALQIKSAGHTTALLTLPLSILHLEVCN